LSKVFETAIRIRLCKFFEINNLLSEAQHGFRRGRSTESALASLMSTVYTQINQGMLVASLNCDLSKAFDCVDHGLLMAKLFHYGIRGNSYKLLESYLGERSQVTEIVDPTTGRFASSRAMTVGRGVPQGSILGPFLFLVFMNDLPSNITGFTTLYADDTSVCVCAENENSLKININQALTQLIEWFAANELQLNVDKTNIIVFPSEAVADNFKISCEKVEFSPSPVSSLLGLCIDSRLSWEGHFTSLRERLNRAIFALRRLKPFCSFYSLLSVYYGYFHSIISYAVLCWGNKQNLECALKLQKRAVRVLCGLGPRDSCRERFLRLSIFTIVNVFIYKCGLYAFDHGFCGAGDVGGHSYNMRNRYKIRPSIPNSSLYEKSFTYISTKIYNHIPYDVRDSQSRKTFQNKLKVFLKNNSFYSVNEFLEHRWT